MCYSVWEKYVTAVRPSVRDLWLSLARGLCKQDPQASDVPVLSDNALNMVMNVIRQEPREKA